MPYFNYIVWGRLLKIVINFWIGLGISALFIHYWSYLLMESVSWMMSLGISNTQFIGSKDLFMILEQDQAYQLCLWHTCYVCVHLNIDTYLFTTQRYPVCCY